MRVGAATKNGRSSRASAAAPPAINRPAAAQPRRGAPDLHPGTQAEHRPGENLVPRPRRCRQWHQQEQREEQRRRTDDLEPGRLFGDDRGIPAGVKKAGEDPGSARPAPRNRGNERRVERAECDEEAARDDHSGRIGRDAAKRPERHKQHRDAGWMQQHEVAIGQMPERQRIRRGVVDAVVVPVPEPQSAVNEKGDEPQQDGEREDSDKDLSTTTHAK